MSFVLIQYRSIDPLILETWTDGESRLLMCDGLFLSESSYTRYY